VNKEEIFEKIKPIISNSLDVDPKEVTLDKTLQDLHADSLDSVETIMEIETVFNIAIPDTEMEKFSNIQSIVDHISTQVK